MLGVDPFDAGVSIESGDFVSSLDSGERRFLLGVDPFDAGVSIESGDFVLSLDSGEFNVLLEAGDNESGIGDNCKASRSLSEPLDNASSKRTLFFPESRVVFVLELCNSSFSSMLMSEVRFGVPDLVALKRETGN